MSLFTTASADFEDFDVIECPNGHSRRFHQRHGGHVRKLHCHQAYSPRRFPWELEKREDIEPDGLYCGQCGALADFDAADALWGLTDFPMQALDIHAPSADLERAVMDSMPGMSWHREVRPARAARFAPWPEAVLPELQASARPSLYTHQAAALEAALAGCDVLQTTGTASGKSVGLMLPTMQRLLSDPTATAVAMFPMKALVTDQIGRLIQSATSVTSLSDDWSLVELSFGGQLPSVVVGKLDSDVPKQQRLKILAAARLLISTPDQLHMTVLPESRRDSTFVQNLKVVVIDEVHSYNDELGSNLAALLRRLEVTVRHRGGDRPQYFMASASVAEPERLYRSLTGRKGVVVIDDDGSPQHEFVLLVGERDGVCVSRHQATKSDDDVAQILSGVCASFEGSPPSALVFRDSKAGGEILRRRIVEEIDRGGFPSMSKAVGTYNGGHASDARRESERNIRSGDQRITITTSALELGVDLSSVSFVVLTEPPSTQAELKQRLGRAGRGGPGVGVVLISAQRTGAWPVTPEQIAEDAFGPMRTMPLPIPSVDAQVRIGLEGISLDLGHIPAWARGSFDELVWQRLAVDSNWHTSTDGSLHPNTPVALAAFRPNSQTYTVVNYDGRELMTFDIFRAVKEGWVGNVVEDHRGERFEVTAVSEASRAIKVRRAGPDLNARSSVRVTLSEYERLSDRTLGSARVMRAEGELSITRTSAEARDGDLVVSRGGGRAIGSKHLHNMPICLLDVPTLRSGASRADLGELVISCLDVIGVSRNALRIDMVDSQLAFYNARGGSGTAAWTLAERLADIIAAARERLAMYGGLTTSSGWVSAESFGRLLDSFSDDPLERAA